MRGENFDAECCKDGIFDFWEGGCVFSQECVFFSDARRDGLGSGRYTVSISRMPLAYMRYKPTVFFLASFYTNNVLGISNTWYIWMKSGYSFHDMHIFIVFL